MEELKSTLMNMLYGLLENLEYSCAESGHIFGQWWPENKTHIRRTCVVPGCHAVHSKKAQ